MQHHPLLAKKRATGLAVFTVAFIIIDLFAIFNNQKCQINIKTIVYNAQFFSVGGEQIKL